LIPHGRTNNGSKEEEVYKEEGDQEEDNEEGRQEEDHKEKEHRKEENHKEKEHRKEEENHKEKEEVRLLFGLGRVDGTRNRTDLRRYWPYLRNGRNRDSSKIPFEWRKFDKQVLLTNLIGLPNLFLMFF